MPRQSDFLHSGSQPDYVVEPVVISLSDSATVLDVLGSRTARQILGTLAEEPMSVSEVSESVGTSVQNAAYHVGNLQTAGLVEVVDTWYSSKGREMAAYATTCEPLVISVDKR